MSEQLKYCLGCMESIPYETVVCPKCGYNEETVQPAPYLETGNLIINKYLVGRLISVSADTATYIGANTETGETVTVHEFFPANIVTRNEGQSELTIRLGYETMFSGCLQSFLTLWRGLEGFKDTVCLPDVLDIVDYNGTVYAICAFKDYISLSEYFKNTGTPLTWARAVSAFKPIMYALKKLHAAGIVHADLSPETVFVGADGKLHISGFSIPQCQSGVAEFNTAPAGGFAPIERYNSTGVYPATDVYSVTALLYYSITLLTPPDASERIVRDTASLPAAVAATLSKNIIDGLICGLAINPENRYPTMDGLIAALAPPKAPRPRPAAPAPKISQKEEVDREIAREMRELEEIRQEKKSSASGIGHTISGFVVGVLVCAVALCALYATVLYKNYPIDFLDKLLEPITFLPLNGETETTVPTTVAPVPTETAWVTVADFVGSHTYDSVRSSSYFNENYTLKYEFKESDTVPKNSIISQSLAVGESVMKGSEITLVISLGTSKIKLPDVTGDNYKNAGLTLKEAGFTVKYELTENDGTHIAGQVYSMDKSAGALYEKETQVILKVWDKVPETTTAASTTAATTKPSESKPDQDNTTTASDQTDAD